jgi:PAS domain-containing protein
VLPEHRDHATAWLADAYHGKDTRNIDLAVRTQSGARVDLLLSILSRSAHGGGGGAIAVGHDITLRKRAEGRTEHELQAFIAAANAPILGVDTECRINVWNDKIASLTGYSSSEVIGQDRQVCMPGREITAVLAAAAAVRALQSAARVPHLPATSVHPRPSTPSRRTSSRTTTAATAS